MFLALGRCFLSVILVVFEAVGYVWLVGRSCRGLSSRVEVIVNEWVGGGYLRVWMPASWLVPAHDV